MTPSGGGERAAAALARALGCRGQERERLVTTLAGNDARLRATFVELLARAEDDPSLLASGAWLEGALGLDLIERFAARPALLGDTIGSVRLLEVLGEGGMGTVFKGHDEKLERTVAVKTVRPERLLDPGARARFQREARTLSRLNHPGICQVYELIERAEADYLVLEYIEGDTLRSWTSAERSVAARLAVAQGIAEALAAAHERGIVHRDLKPDNVMVSATGGVKVLDFGIARAIESSVAARDPDGGPPPALPAPLAETAAPEPGAFDAAKATLRTRLGSILGTVAYMSPEQARGEEVTAASDVYSLGLIFHELFSGRAAHPPLPFEELLERARRGDAEPAAGLDAPLLALVEAMRAPAPGERPSATQVVARLRAIAERPARRRRRQGLVALLTVALVAVGAASWLTRRAAIGAPLVAPGESGRIVILPAANRTGEAALDWVELGVPELVVRSLARLPNAEILPLEEAARWLRARPSEAGEPSDGELEALARARGALLVVRPSLERAEGAQGELAFSYRTVNRLGARSERTLHGPDPTGLALGLARQLAARLSPGSAAPELAAALAEDPVVNRLYATGVQRLGHEEPAAAGPFFRVCLSLEPSFDWARLRLAQVELLAGNDEALATLLEETGPLAPDQKIERALLEGQLAAKRGQWEQAATIFAEARSAARDASSPAAEGRILRAWAQADMRRGNVEARERELAGDSPLLGEARRIFTALGDESGLVELDLVALSRRINSEVPSDEQLGKLRAAHEKAVRLGDSWVAHLVKFNLASALVRLRRYDEAEPMIREAVAILDRGGDRDSMLLALNNLGVVLQNTGRPDEAADTYRRVRAHARAAGRIEPEVLATMNEATIRMSQHRPAEARALRGEALSLSPALRGNLVFEVTGARLLYEEGRFGEAWSRFRALLAENPGLEKLVEGYIEPMRTAARTGVRQPVPDDL